MWYGVSGGEEPKDGGILDVSRMRGMSMSFSSAIGVREGEGDRTTEGIRAWPRPLLDPADSGTRVIEPVLIVGSRAGEVDVGGAALGSH